MQKLCDIVLCSDNFFNLSYGSGQLWSINHYLYIKQQSKTFFTLGHHFMKHQQMEKLELLNILFQREPIQMKKISMDTAHSFLLFKTDILRLHNILYRKVLMLMLKAIMEQHHSQQHVLKDNLILSKSFMIKELTQMLRITKV